MVTYYSNAFTLQYINYITLHYDNTIILHYHKIITLYYIKFKGIGKSFLKTYLSNREYVSDQKLDRTNMGAKWKYLWLSLNT